LNCDLPDGVVTFTFSGTLGWWDATDTTRSPYRDPPAATIEITDGLGKVVLEGTAGAPPAFSKGTVALPGLQSDDVSGLSAEHH